MFVTEVAPTGITSMIENLGFPIVCVVALVFWVQKIHRETIEMQLRQEKSSQEAIKEANESNRTLMKSNMELLETNRLLAQGINTKLDGIENNLIEIKKTIETK